MKSERAQEIAEELNNTKKWYSHSYDKSLETLEKDLKLKIDDFGKNSEQSGAISGYQNLLSVYTSHRRMSGVIHTANRFKPYI